MNTTLLLNERELKELVQLDLGALQCIKEAFLALATKRVVMPPILRLDISEHRGEIDVKTAYIPGSDHFAIKISPGFFDNPKLGLPSTSGMMAVFCSKTGLLHGLLFDNGYLTDVRTAAAGALAADMLARKDSTVAAILGAGMQAKLQLKALTLVRPIREARIWAREYSKAVAAAEQMSEELGMHVSACAAPSRAVAGADVIITTTSANQPILRADWLEAGQHITAMGSDAEHKNEVEPAVVARADVYVADRLSQTRRLGELHHAIAAGVVSADANYAELGEIIAGHRPGRIDAAQISIADLTGTGIQDTAIATLAFAKAKEANVGITFKN